MRYTRRACSHTAVSSRSSSCCANAMASTAIADSAITPAPIHEERYSVAFVRNNFARNKLLKRIALSADRELGRICRQGTHLARQGGPIALGCASIFFGRDGACPVSNENGKLGLYGIDRSL